MHNASLKCFGIGDGFPDATRGHSSFLYQLEGKSVLIDCGEPLTSRYQAAGLSYDLVDQLILSHLHADHVGGFLMFMQALWLKKRQKNLPIKMPADGIVPVKAMLDAAYLFDELFEFQLNFSPLAAGETFHVGNIRITPYRTKHLDGFIPKFRAKYRQSFDSFCFLIETGKLRIGHSADLGEPEDLAPLVAQPLDLLVCELAHFKVESLFQFLAGRAIKKVVFIHLTKEGWQNQSQILADAAKALPHTQISIAQPGETVTL